MNKKIIFKGSAVAVVTPFDGAGNINFKMFEKLVDFQISGGVQAVVVCGTTGESAVISSEERDSLIKFSVNKFKNKVPIIVGTGSNCTEHAVSLSTKAQELGADALLIVTPYYNKTSQLGLIKHYEFIASKVEIPMILYNVPSRTGMNIAPQTYLELSKIENIVATKEANGDISSVIKTISLCGDDLVVYSGNDDQTLPILSVGGIGVISVFSNILPDISQKIASNSKDAAELLMKYQDLMEALFWDVNPVPIKAALKLMGFDCGKCRMPLAEMENEKEKKLKKIMEKHGIL
ncbi:MAG: 4-hydroxy-tetrahydrodipicolinate synthase [Oscillospiraceae bacterium]|nr:4-hydroxy-tetrahydrodipicolinate synthase [Oscillospiraceae bacterium]